MNCMAPQRWAPSRPLPPTRSIEVVEMGQERMEIRGPIPLIIVPRRDRDPGQGPGHRRDGPARASPGAPSAPPPA